VARSKPQVLVIADLKAAEQALSEIAQIERSIKGVEAGLNEIIDRAKAGAKLRTEPLAARRKELEAALAQFAEHNKAELFAKRKSLDLAFGVIGFRLTTSIKAASKTTWAMILGKIRDYGFSEAIRSKAEVDKEILRGWSDEKLATVGARRDTKDEFYIDIKAEVLEGDAA